MMGERSLETYAEDLRGRLGDSRLNCQRLDSSLQSFTRHLSTLEMALLPVKANSHTLVTISDNAERAMAMARQILKEYDAPRQMESVVREERPDSPRLYFAIKRLQASADFFKAHKSFKGSRVAITHAEALATEGLKRSHGFIRSTLQHIELRVKEERTSTESRSTASSVLASRGAVFHVSEDDAASLRTCFKGLKDIGRRQEGLTLYREERSKQLLALFQDTFSGSKAFVTGAEWKEVDQRIQGWRAAFKNLVHHILPAEQTLATKLLGHTSLSTQGFTATAEALLDAGLAPVRAVCQLPTSPERLFTLLDVYKALTGAMGQLKELFESRDAFIVEEVQTAVTRVQAAIQATVQSFQRHVEQDSGVQLAADASIHPLTAYVINYLKLLAGYEKSLLRVLVGHPAQAQSSPVDELFVSTLALLEGNLRLKSRLFNDEALAPLFLMNQAHYILSAVTRYKLLRSEEEWVRSWKAKVSGLMEAYLKSTSARMLRALTNGAQVSLLAKLGQPWSKGKMRECLAAFEGSLDQEVRKQAKWVVTNTEQRQILRTRLRDAVLAAYQAWLDNHREKLQVPEKPMFGGGREVYPMPTSTSDLAGRFEMLFQGIGTDSQGSVP